MASFFHFSYALDIAIVSLFIYLFFIFIKQTRSYFVFYTLIAIVSLNILSDVFDLGLTRKILNPILAFFLVIFIIVFQREIRRFFHWLVLSRGHLEKKIVQIDEAIASYLATALSDMAKKRIGAIVVLSGEYPLDDIIEGGFSLDGKITVPLLMSIFDDSTPGHDGAVLIENRRISKFGVHLPLAENFRGFSSMGTRHRAACGITERTDALALVVSEERGTISVAQRGVIRTISDKSHLEEILHSFIKTEHTPDKNWWTVFVAHNMFLKILSIAIAAGLWFFFIFQASILSKDLVVPFEFQKVPEGLQVSKISPTSVTVTISGVNQDIVNLKDGDIRIVVNLKNREPGSFDVPIGVQDVIKPSYVNIIRIEPAEFNVTLDPINTVPAEEVLDAQ